MPRNDTDSYMVQTDLQGPHEHDNCDLVLEQQRKFWPAQKLQRRQKDEAA